VSAQDALNAAAIAYAVSQGYTKPVVPPQPPTATPEFDGRATVTKSPFPTTSGTGNSVVQTPPMPYPVWDGYEYMGADVKLAQDATFGSVYQFSPPAGHHSPAWTGATPNVTQAYLACRRPTGLGQTFYWSDSITLVSSSKPDWGTFISLGYQTILYDQLALGVGGTGIAGDMWSIHLSYGLVSNGNVAQVFAPLKPVTLGQRTDWVIGAHVAADSSGWVEVHYRPQGGSWSQVFSKTGIPTVEWTSVDSSGKPVVGSTVLDKEELYFGWWSQTKTPAPTGVARTRGLQRWGTLTDAVASLG
jgi:hypothetical protein